MARRSVAPVPGEHRNGAIRELLATDVASATELLEAELGGRMQARRGELIDVLEGEGLVAVDESGLLGLVSWGVDTRGLTAEIRALAVVQRARRRGIGRRLLEQAQVRLRRRGIRTAWLITTNDNAGAIVLYRRAGYRLKARKAGAVDELRRTIKPSIAEIGEGGVPITDELEFEALLGGSEAPLGD